MTPGVAPVHLGEEGGHVGQVDDLGVGVRHTQEFFGQGLGGFMKQGVDGRTK